MPSKQMIEMPAEKLPVMDEADVVVVGGGSSGFLAAVAAARAGANTLLIERHGYLGGCSTAPYNTSIGWLGDSHDQLIIRGLPMEYLKRMETDGQAFITRNGTKNQIWPPYTKKIAFDMVEEAGVNLWLHSWAYDVVMEGDVLKGVVIQTKGGRGVVLGHTFVDTSADVDIAAWCGAPNQVEDIENIQQVSCDYIACGVDAAQVVEWARENKDRLGLRVSGLDAEHKDGGPQQMFTITIPGDSSDFESQETFHLGWMPTVKLCIYREAVRIQGNSDIDPLDPKALTRAEVDGLRGAIYHLTFMSDNVPGFENALSVSQANLGGRCISCDHLSQASIRGAATCMATGHAAGTSAAVAALNDRYVRDVDIREIQRTLIEQDTILSVIDSRQLWLGEPATVWQSTIASMAAD